MRSLSLLVLLYEVAKAAFEIRHNFYSNFNDVCVCLLHKSYVHCVADPFLTFRGTLLHQTRTPSLDSQISPHDDISE